MQEAWVPALVRELKSHMLWGVAKIFFFLILCVENKSPSVIKEHSAMLTQVLCSKVQQWFIVTLSTFVTLGSKNIE